MSGNYQSRVFTFISKRTNRLKDTCAQGFRQIKIAVVWSGQALLYPFHLLAQTTKIFQPQITPPAQAPILPPVADINIEQALELVVDAGHPILLQRGSANAIAEGGSLATTAPGGRVQRQAAPSKVALLANEDSSNLGYYDPDTDDWEVSSYSPRRSQQVVTKKPVIQGLSSLLIDRHLVLVTTENEILDILTSSQQQEIRRRIGIDLAIDWYQWHTGEILVGGASLFSLGRGSANAERLPCLTAGLRQQQKENRYAPEQLILDGKNAAEQLTITGSPEQSTPNLFVQLQDWFKSFTAKPEASMIRSNDVNPEQVTFTSPHQIAPATYSFTPQPPQLDRLFNLPQLPPIHEDRIELTTDRDHPISSTLIKLQPEWLKQWWSYYREYLSIPTTGFNDFESSQIIHQPAEFQLTLFEQPSNHSTERAATNNQLTIGKATQTSNLTHNQNLDKPTAGKLDRKIFQDVEHDPDWIETAAEQVGYSRSPIAKLLEWIDKIILQIENWLIKIWEMITNNLTKT